MRLSQVASVFLKRRIRPRYIRIKVNAKFPGAVCVAPVPLPVAYSNHRPVETMREGGWGRGRKWELRGTKEERRWKWVNGGEKRIFFFWRQVQKRGKNGRRWLWNLHQSGGGKNWGNVKGESVKDEKEIVQIKYLYFFVYVHKRWRLKNNYFERNIKIEEK